MPLKSQNFDVFMPHKYKSILWGPRIGFLTGSFEGAYFAVRN